MEALVWAGALDKETTQPSATYPRDIFFDRSPNPYINKHPNLSDCWYPPARFTACPNPGPNAQDGPPVDAKVSLDTPPQ